MSFYELQQETRRFTAHCKLADLQGSTEGNALKRYTGGTTDCNTLHNQLTLLSSYLKVKAAMSVGHSKTFVPFYQIIRCQIPQTVILVQWLMPQTFGK